VEDGEVYEGRLRFGGNEEALWGNQFNGVKAANPWAEQVSRDQLSVRDPIEVFGIQVATRERDLDLGRPFMARFGDIARIDARFRVLTVPLRSEAEIDLDRFSADDFADGVRVWDESRGVVDLGERNIRSIEFLSNTVPSPLFGTVRTKAGTFTGFVQWNREACLVTDTLDGFVGDGASGLRFADIRSIARSSADETLVTLIDGRDVTVSAVSRGGVGALGNRGVYVDDARYGRVLVSWEAFERVDFGAGGPGPGYADFAPGEPLSGSVVTHSGDRLSGRLVYDLDESETTETLDAPFGGVDYTLPFALIASVVPATVDEVDTRARITLRSGEVLELEAAGDDGEGNAGVLVFATEDVQPEYVPWADVERIELEGQR
jgi:hypothetical protein